MMPQFVAVLGEVPESGLVRIPLVKIGRWFKGKLKFAITRDTVKQLVANFAKKANDEVVIDYDHGSVYAAGSGQPVPASGWLKSVDPAPDADGILWGQAEFTEAATGMLRKREYKYVSPVIDFGARDRKSGEPQGATITSVALTNMPVLDEMPAIALSEKDWVVDTATEEGDRPMVKQLILADRAAGTVRVILSDGTESMVSVEGLTPEPKVLHLADLKRTADGRFDFVALSETDHLIAPEVFRAHQVQSELDAAVKDGKITPAQRPAMEKLALSDIEAFRGFLAAQKKQIDLSERGLAGSGAEGGELPAVDAQLDKLAKEKISANNGITYGQAFKLVLSEHPDLAKRRLALMREE